jgi:transcriptional regulator with XRE-family HTH domain
MNDRDDMDERQEDKDKRYAELVGERLRRMRQERGMSLQEVCSRSGGSFVVSTLSAYERGKRSLSLERLCELAAIYGQSPMSLLDIGDEGEFQRSLTNNGPLRIDLENLDKLPADERRPLETYLSFLRQLRNDPARDMLTIRKEDLAYLSGLYGVRPQALKDYLEKEGILLTW